MTNESQQINLTNKYGVLDMAEGDDGSDPLFAHKNVQKEEAMDESMESLREAEAEVKNASKNKDKDSVAALAGTMWR